MNSIDLLNTDEDNPNGVQRITVTLEDMKDKSVLFEGQVVAIEGLAETSTNFIGQKVIPPKINASPKPLPANKGHMTMMYVNGPYTFNTTLSYSPLQILVQ